MNRLLHFLPMLPRLTQLLDDSLDPAHLRRLAQYRFESADDALRLLKRMAKLSLPAGTPAGAAASPSGDSVSGVHPEWYLTLDRILREAPLRDVVLQTIEQFLQNARHLPEVFARLDAAPRALDVLSRLASCSPFLTGILLADPAHLFAVTDTGRISEMKSLPQFRDEALAESGPGSSQDAVMSGLRRYQRRELLRIGICDAFGLLDLRFVTLQLSLLAQAMVDCCLFQARQSIAADTQQVSDVAPSLCVIALGKLGGEELNYSSDIDLLIVARDAGPASQRVARLMVELLSANRAPGFLYRTDLRLRPWGSAGPLVSSVAAAAGYFANDAGLWEKQAMLKARIVAGDAETGMAFLQAIQPLLFTEPAAVVRRNVQQMKERIEHRLRQRGRAEAEVKLGVGSIRDVEFLVQSLQLIHGGREPRILSCNTLDSLVRLTEFGLLSAADFRQLRAGYSFLRTIEHSLQLLHNQQTHELPADSRALEWLAFRLDFPSAAVLLDRYAEHRAAIRQLFEAGLVVVETAAVNKTAASPPDAVASAIHEQPAGNDGLPEIHAARRQRVLELLSAVNDGQPVIVEHWCAQPADGPGLIVESAGQGGTPVAESTELLLAGLEFSGWLSTICGLLSILRLDIRRGDALTGAGTNRFGDECVAGRFLACFEVQSMAGGPLDPQAVAIRLQEELLRLSGLVRDGRIEDVRSELLSRFCSAVPSGSGGAVDMWLQSVEVSLTPVENSVLTRMDIAGRDSWGFLYELTSSLSLGRFRVLRAIIDADREQVRDVLFVRERNGLPVSSPSRREELILAATLIKQFAHWLPATSDPHAALRRFRELVRRLRPDSDGLASLAWLQQPGVLPEIARVLGISQYLWETFLHSPPDQLPGLLATAGKPAGRVPRPTLEAELRRRLESAVTASEQWTVLNQFKDSHLFRIDVRNVTGRCRPFGAFSEELTELADVVVSAAVRIACDQLIAELGRPLRASDGQPCEWCACGLGKYGGMEMGFASDIELMLVYDEAGRTDARQPVSNALFFDRVVSQVAGGMITPQDGIFHIDLRMRPFGQAGIGAVSLADFVRYYEPGGPAWPFERQSLTRLRFVAGSRTLEAGIQAAVTASIFSGRAFDFPAMRAMRDRQLRQLVRGGTTNAKLSDGGIVDCEYAVQALQMSFGHQVPALRQPNTLNALRAAADYGLIDTKSEARVRAAYIFLRQVIDCLRLVRGNARDLTIPPAGSLDFRQLDLRLKMIHGSAIALDRVEQQLFEIRRFASDVERMCGGD